MDNLETKIIALIKGHGLGEVLRELVSITSSGEPWLKVVGQHLQAALDAYDRRYADD